MTTDETPIWEVIEQFKDKVKTQESELKKRRDKIESFEAELDKTRKELDARAARLRAVAANSLSSVPGRTTSNKLPAAETSASRCV